MSGGRRTVATTAAAATAMAAVVATAMAATAMAAVVAAVVLAACGGAGAPPAGSPGGAGAGDAAGDPPGVVRDTRSPLQRRRDAACEQLGPRLAACAVEDSRAQLAAGAITQAQFDEATRPEVRRALAEDWRKKCGEGYMSSRQVRVLEVCYREETACGPLEACLRHLDAQSPSPGR